MVKIEKIVKAKGEYAKKGIDINDGDMVAFTNEGQWVTGGQYGDQFVIGIETPNGVKNTNLNQTSLNILNDELGEESKDWVGKSVLIKAKKDVVAGRKVDIYYFVTPDWDFDEYRELVRLVPKDGKTIEYPEDEISPDDI